MTTSTLDRPPPSRPLRRREREGIYALSRALTVVIVLVSVGTLLIQPLTPAHWVLDVLGRAWLMFLGTVMAHEATHGHLGRTRRANMWWGRLALVPGTVPFVNFRKTHMKHHLHTNDPQDDPDYFVVPKRTILELPVRAVLHPHYWIYWLAKRGMIRRRDALEWALHDVALFTLYGAIGLHMGWERLAWGMGLPLFIVSLVLWHWFAGKTHEGLSTSDSEYQSHNYYGALTFWMTLGLSLHRVHHEHPKLAWIETLPFVEEDPRGFWSRHLGIRRDIRLEVEAH